MKKKHGKEKFFLKFEWLLDKLTLATIISRHEKPDINIFIHYTFCV